MPIEAILVVVPVQNEEELLPRCIASLEAAVATVECAPGVLDPPPAVRVVLVLDSCVDASAEIAAHSSFEVLTLNADNVGAARRTGVAAGLARLSAVEHRRIWIANTDADSAVQADWLVYQARLAASGVELTMGAVVPDTADLDPVLHDRWQAAHVVGEASVHGANLGVRADVYCACGGFEAITEHEDVRLVERARASGARMLATDDCVVLTSGRASGRTPGGYAGYLRGLSA